MRYVVGVMVAIALTILSTSSAPAAAAGPSVSWSHADCVGPGLPGTAPPHSAHTDVVNGFVAGGARISLTVNKIGFFGAGGICPTSLAGPVLPQDFTGRFHVTAVCGGPVQNPGAVFLDARFDSVAGATMSESGGIGNCVAPPGTVFSLAITVEISDVTFAGVTLPPTGGVTANLSQ